jgi:hypothetical protein
VTFVRIKAECAVMNEGWQEPKETIVPKDDAEKTIEEWVEWFRTQLKEALAKGEDVEILLGRQPPSSNHFAI